MLKPQDTLIALKYCSLFANQMQLALSGRDISDVSSYRSISDFTSISLAEVSRSVKRLESSRLLHRHDSLIYPVKKNVQEWLIHGICYYLPIVRSGYGRGVPTGWNCKLLSSEMMAPSPGWVWEDSTGEGEGEFIQPFHQSVAFASKSDKWLYEFCSLIDVLRGGKPRELSIAKEMLEKKLENVRT